MKEQYEYTLTTDEFRKPRILKNNDAISQLLIHLILLEPGTYSNRPEMGVGLVSHYRYSKKDELHTLSNKIQEQIQTYLPEFDAVDVSVYYDEKDANGEDIIIDIELDGTVYKFETSKQEDNKIGLKDLK